MRLDLRAIAYPSLLEAVGLAIVHFDGMESSIPRVFQAALNCGLHFQREVFDATRGLEVHLKLTEAAIKEGAPNFLDQWKEIAGKVRSSAAKRGKVAHAGLSIYGGGVMIETDEEGTPTGLIQLGKPVASLFRSTRSGHEQISESEIRELAERILAISNDINRLAADIVASRIA